MAPTNLTECLAWLDEVKSKNGGPASEEYVRRDMGRATPRFAEFVASRVAECLRGHLQGEAIFGTNIPAPDPSPPKNCMAIGCTASSKPWGEGEAIKAPAPALKMGFDMEVLAEAVHEAYLTTCARLGWHVKEANRVPYSELSEDSKELDRASVRAVLASLPAPAPMASANTIPEWWPECPYPESVFPLKTEELVRLIPDPAQRTSISGYYGRLFWNIASKAIFDSWKFNRDFGQEAAPGAAPTTEKGGEA